MAPIEGQLDLDHRRHATGDQPELVVLQSASRRLPAEVKLQHAQHQQQHQQHQHQQHQHHQQHQQHQHQHQQHYATPVNSGLQQHQTQPAPPSSMDCAGGPNRGPDHQANQSRHLASSSQASNEDHTDEDLMSYWSDSAASNCDRASASPSQGRQHEPPSQHQAATSPASSATCLPKRGNNNTLSVLNNQNQNQNQNINLNNGHTDMSYSNSSNSNEAGPTGSSGGGGAGGGRQVRKRVMANERERERTKSLNQALLILRGRLPVPEAEKRSKIQTLRMAKEYIEFLSRFKKISQQQQQQQQQVEPDSSSAHQPLSATTMSAPVAPAPTNQYSVGQPNQKSFEQASGHHHQASDQSRHQSDSPLNYKFYKFRLKSQARAD